MINRFDILQTPISGLHILSHRLTGDNRGHLERLYCMSELKPLMGDRMIIQINRTLTKNRGTVRGMHFQYPPHAEVKIISCLKGEVFDVAVDIRKNAPTFLQWHSEILSEGGNKSFYIPEGFAHGFQSLTDNCELIYFHTAAYQPDHEGGLNARDPGLAIQWPLPISELSERDLSHPHISSEFIGVSQ